MRVIHPQSEVSSCKTHFVSEKLICRARAEKGGLGVFAETKIKSGELLVIWGGVITSFSELKTIDQISRRHSIQVEEGFYLVPQESPETGDFINHSCNPNAGLSGQLALVAIRDIGLGEEICYDYAMSDGSPYDEFECSCHSKNCRGRVTGNDWQIKDLQIRYAGYFSPYLQRRIVAQGKRGVVHFGLEDLMAAHPR